jgi:hypothetical protein
MEDNRLPKQLLDYHPKGKRRPGRPRKRLLDDMIAETETDQMECGDDIGKARSTHFERRNEHSSLVENILGRNQI